jgi:hypothetical protein
VIWIGLSGGDTGRFSRPRRRTWLVTSVTSASKLSILGEMS